MKKKIFFIVLALIIISLIPIKQTLKDGVYLRGKEFRAFPLNWIKIGDYSYDNLEKVKL